MKKYPIIMDGVDVGVAMVEYQGLYADVVCRCRVADEKFCRMNMTFQDEVVDLGLWIREGEQFVVRRKIPRKAFGKGEPSFFAVPKCGNHRKNLCPIFPDKPFDHIKELLGGKLCIRNHSMYLEF